MQNHQNQNQNQQNPSTTSTTTSPVILLRRNESDPAPSNFQSHTLLIDGTSNLISNSNQFIFGSTQNENLIRSPSQSDHNQSSSLLHSSTSLQNPTISDKTLDPTVVEAMMTGTVRDKQILLQAEVEMLRFLTSTQDRQPFGAALSTSLNSYQRMLVHRLGDSFGIKRSIEMGHIYMERTPLSACPSTRLDSFIIRQDASPSNAAVSPQERSPSLNIPNIPQEEKIASSPNTNEVKASTASTAPLKTFKIMSRTPSQRSSSRQTSKGIAPSAGSSVSSADATNSDAKRNELSYEARQAAYQQARNRIFAAGTSESAEDDGIPKESSESETTTSSRNLDSSLNDDSNPSNDQSVPSSNDPSSGNGPIRIAQALNKGKEKMIANSKFVKPPTVVAKLRPGATAFDPNAKAHGYEEVTIIDFDDSQGPIPWSAPTGYEYPSEPISRQAYHSRQIRAGQLYGSDAFPIQSHPACGPLNGEHAHHDGSYPMFSTSNAPHYLDSQSGPHSGMNPMVSYEHPSSRIFPPPSGPIKGDLNRYPQNSGFPTPSFSIPNGRSINPGPTIQSRIPIQQDRFHVTPYSGVDHEMGNQGSDRSRGTYLSADLNPGPTRSHTVPPSLPPPPPPESQNHQGLNFSHSMSYPSLHPISPNPPPIPSVHMNHSSYQVNHSNHHPFDSQFQTTNSSVHPTSGRDSGTSSVTHLTPQAQFHPTLITPPTYASDPNINPNSNHSIIDYSQVVDPRLSTLNGNHNSSSSNSSGSNGNHYLGPSSSSTNHLNHSNMNPFLPLPTVSLRFDSMSQLRSHPSSSSIISDETSSSSNQSSSNLTAASNLSKRQMNGGSLGHDSSGSGSRSHLGFKAGSQTVGGTRTGYFSLNQLGIFGSENGMNGMKNRYEAGRPASVGGVSNCSSSNGSIHRNQNGNSKNQRNKNHRSSGNSGNSQKSGMSGKSGNVLEEEDLRGMVDKVSSVSEDEWKTNLEARLDDDEKKKKKIEKEVKGTYPVGVMVMQHPLPAKPLWVGGSSNKSMGRGSNTNTNTNGKHRGVVKSETLPLKSNPPNGNGNQNQDQNQNENQSLLKDDEPVSSGEVKCVDVNQTVPVGIVVVEDSDLKDDGLKDDGSEDQVDQVDQVDQLKGIDQMVGSLLLDESHHGSLNDDDDDQKSKKND
ncbi:uncharacterized protein MELLADRAFT_92083 [Melampsora larici-populina 98AG31]|uniref:SUZ domain-containing protein n=1 Tax=Melampsora larici-populina (strain 98AG31 / pathotype 3-4-7) TaxID=747676 RepID=F4S1G4_MELLP|nr:uncharacterized protein MELLADRAFT_92083 [Melampsora larici-populina 98AG31]EGG01565.1 hypothetical protein MELLADRAFT_92083 [Melampsora larici-populina 98AG31]